MDTTIVFAAEVPAATIAGRVARGDLVRLASGVYTTDVRADPATVVRREWHTIAGRALPGAVITDRSAPTGGPVDAILYLTHAARDRRVALPGLTMLARRGAGPLPGDVRLPGGLHQASTGRALAENTRASRSRGGRPRRTLDPTELADWIDRLCQINGNAKLSRYREQAERLAGQLGATETGMQFLNQLVGAALGTQAVDIDSRALRARQTGHPLDQGRMRLLETLVDALRSSAPQNRPVTDPGHARYAHLPFFEAYFSNFIEGTEFVLEEALAIVYDGKQIAGRAADSHDLLGTFRVVSDLDEMTTVASSDEQFITLLRSRHATIMAGRPDKRPGEFKEVANRAGESLFVLPALVEATLRAGFDLLGQLDTAFERAVFTTLLVSEVHPFDDGNGRVARAMMNAELVAGGQSRIIVPTVFCDDYLGGLRQLTRRDDPSVLIKALRYVHDYTAQVDFSSIDGARAMLAATHAFADPDSLDRLILPNRIGAAASGRTPAAPDPTPAAPAP